jgi:hypothetical protein
LKTYKLLKPIQFEGEEISEIEYDLENLTSATIERVEKELASDGGVMISVVTSPTAQGMIFAEAAKKPMELIRMLKLPDFVAITAEVQAFLTGQD